MQSIDVFFNNLYKDFNERKIDSVISHMTEDVQWANGMDGGYVHGKKAVHDYWTRQFGMISSKVTPIKIEKEKEWIKIWVHQVVHDLKGALLSDQVIEHYFLIKGDKIDRFEIGTHD